MSVKSRTYNSFVNSIWGIVASAVTIALNFVVRVVLVYQLGEEINGINSLFQSIISMMSLMELGISSAMIIHLYEPVKNKDEIIIAGIMNYYRRIYNYVAVCFAIVGILVSFFVIDKLVTSSIPINYVRVYFIFFTACFVVNYLTFYKRSILYAEQKNRISVAVSTFCEVVFRSIQIAILIIWHSYIAFLLIMMIEKLASNLICKYYVDKSHPYLRKNLVQISQEKRSAIINTIKPLMIYQTAGTIQGTATSILISILLGNVAIVGYYGVYQMIIGVVTLLFSQIGGAFTTSFGNLAVENNHKHMVGVYRKSAFLINWLACISCSLFIACADDFIGIFFGPNFILSSYSVIILTVQLFVQLLIIPIVSVQNAMGLHRYVRTPIVLQALLAIILSYIGGLYWGMPGILMGQLIPTIIFSLIYNGVVISFNAFSMSKKDFLFFESSNSSLLLIAMIVVYSVIGLFINSTPFVELIIKAVVAIIISVFLPSLFFIRNKEMKNLKVIMCNLKYGNKKG